MAYKLFNDYMIEISKDVIDQFGGSYQTYETLSKTWRKEFEYRESIEQFLFMRTKLFLRQLDPRIQGNFNVIYTLCDQIATYQSKYTMKKTPYIARETAKEEIMKKIFFEFDKYTVSFQKQYKKPIDMTNEAYVKSNPGIIAMYQYLQNKK